MKLEIEKLNQLIDLALKKGAHQAEVHSNLVYGFSVNIRNHKKEQQEKHLQKSYSLRVYKNQKSASINSADFSNQGINNAAEKCCSLALLSEPDSGIELANRELMAKNIRPQNLYYPNNTSLDEAFNLASEAEDGLLNTKNNIRSDSTSFNSIENQHYYCNSHGFNYEQISSQYSIGASAIAESKGEMETEYEYDIQLDKNDLMRAEKIGIGAAKKALRKIDSQKIKTTKAPVLFSFECSSSLISHLLGTLSGESQYHEQSFYLKSLGKKVLPDFIDIFENPFIEKSLYSQDIDAQGLAKKKQFFIQSGKIKSYLLSHYSATKLKMKHTANAGGTSNIIAQQKNSPSFADLVIQMNRGLIVTQLMGLSINPITGHYSRGASGFWVENGLIQYPVKEITIADNLKEMYQNIVAIARDVDLRKSIRVGSILIEQMTIAGN